MRRAIVQVQRRLGGRASPESGRIIAPSFEKSYCRTMRQVIDRHRTIEQGNVIFRETYTYALVSVETRTISRFLQHMEISPRNRSSRSNYSSLNLIFEGIKEYKISFRSVMEKCINRDLFKVDQIVGKFVRESI